ncbi:MAG: Glu-tRNA(Gln) amidotransferase subunit GatE [Candidatus Woesearchaeota archaeon]|nr:Glu-tRNA(Gln) amidotransferase subunit GatE [Candidatus Woesearchaeota archaeon]
MKEELKNLGIRCGLEIHQQLSTGKLFCRCPSTIIEGEPDLRVKRKLKAVAGELGETDEAAEYESQRGKQFIYNFYRNANCLVELDEEPPHEPNQEAIATALQISIMLNAKPFPELQFMRKTVVDGSNTSGFQRTGLLAVNGEIEVLGKKVSIPTLCIEEEACKIVERTPNHDVYNLSRLGIPLVEIATGPELSSPEEVLSCAEKIGMILRSTGKVKRGIGTIRQDVNVSIAGGRRVEIKGAQELRMLPRIVEIEALRQKHILEIKEELKKRGIQKIESETKDITSALKNTKSKILRDALNRNGRIIGARLSGMKGLIGKELQPNKRLGTEMSEYAKKFGVSGILHCDELPGYGITEKEAEIIGNELSCSENDGFFIIASDSKRAREAVAAAIKRAELSVDGVPQEVRKANADGTTSFMRPMSGSSRMYPETDVPPLKISAEGIRIPKLITEIADEYREMGLNSQMAEIVSKSAEREFFNRMVESCGNVEPRLIFSSIYVTPKDIKKRLGLDISGIGEREIEKALYALNEGKISKQAVSEALALVASGESIENAIKKFESISASEVEAKVREIIASFKSKLKPGEQLKEGLVMGRVMAVLRGKADGKLITDIIKKNI